MILVINDVHIADRAPLGRVEGYTDQIMAKLEECRSLAGPDDVTIFSGDLFHTKRPSFVSHALVQRLIDLFRDWPGRKLTILGNHDLSEAGIASVVRQPIGVLLRAGVLELLDEDILVRVGGVRVQLSPAHYDDEAGPEHYSASRSSKADRVLKIVHGPIMPPGQSPPFYHVSAADIDADGIDVLAYGHIHDDHGAYEVDGCIYVNFGSLGRIARTESNRTRKVAVAMYDAKTGEVTRHDLKNVLPADEVFIAVEGEEEADGDLKAYARELVYALQRGSSTSIDDLLAEVSEGVPKKVKAGVVRYLNEAGL